nr:MAG TPA: hypothetical protein [Caudoviricetes sp.]
MVANRSVAGSSPARTINKWRVKREFKTSIRTNC